MSEQQKKTIIDPGLSDVFALSKLDIFASLHCVKVGSINTYDPAKKTATVNLAFKRQLPNGTIDTYPLLLDCPVFTPQGGGAYVQFPIQSGDPCLVLFSDRSIDDWYQNGTPSLPSSARMHDLSDGICLVGINYLNDGAPATPTNKFQISYKGTTIQITATGAKLVSTGGAEIDLDTLVTLKNTTGTLMMILNTLLTAIEGIQVVGNLALTPASVAALEAQRLLLQGLLG